jgi:hypothetical protein
MLRLDFSAPVATETPEDASTHCGSVAQLEPTTARAAAMHLFGDEPELPPTWSEGSAMYHTSEKCNRLRAILPNNRVQGKPGLREHCLTCEDIAATKRRG